MALPQVTLVKNLPANAWIGKAPWSWAWQPTPVFLPGESHGRRSLVGYSPWGHKELDPTEQFSMRALLTGRYYHYFHITGKEIKAQFKHLPVIIQLVNSKGRIQTQSV